MTSAGLCADLGLRLGSGGVVDSEAERGAQRGAGPLLCVVAAAEAQ